MIDETGSAGPLNGWGEAPHPLRAGTVLAERYELGEVLGRGGFSVVHAARDRRSGTDVAVKVLRPDRATDEALARLRRELGVAQRASSEHLVRIHSLEESDGSNFLVMERVHGTDLRRLMGPKPLSPDHAASILRQVLTGLRELHSLSIIHRDVKPANILIRPDGHVKLADFGLARDLSLRESSITSSSTTILGTADYLAPEQVLGRPVDARTDLYACGIVLYEVLTGRLPFEAASSLGVLLKRVHDRPDEIRHHNGDCPLWLSRIAARLLAPKAEERYGSAAAVLEQLEARGARASLGQRVRRWMKRS